MNGSDGGGNLVVEKHLNDRESTEKIGREASLFIDLVVKIIVNKTMNEHEEESNTLSEI